MAFSGHRVTKRQPIAPADRGMVCSAHRDLWSVAATLDACDRTSSGDGSTAAQALRREMADGVDQVVLDGGG